MENDLISVIVPIYNVEKYLERCVDSIVRQTYHYIEIILVDDGSPDRCPQICDDFAKTDSRIRVIHKSNGGLSDARNVGIDVAEGNYICFIDSDDYIDVSMIEKLYSALVTNSADMSICSFKYVSDNPDKVFKNEESPIKDEVVSGDFILKEKMFQKMSCYWVVAWNKLYKKELFETLRFPFGKINEDLFIVHKIMRQCKNIACVKEQLYYYCRREDSIMSSKSNVKRLDVVEAFLSIAMDYADFAGYEDAVKKTILNATISYRSFYYNVGIKFLHCYRERNKELQRLYRKAIRICRARGIHLSSKEEKYFFINWISMSQVCRAGYMVNKCNILIRRIERLLKILRYAIQVRKCRYVLVDTPTHGNLGDHAIAMAEKQYLEKQFENIKYIELNADEINYHEKYYAYFTPQNCDIIVHGGGFLGEIWPYEEYRFRRIVKAFNHNRIIVFPQTVTFDLTTESVGKLFNESKKIYSEHPNMVIFVREEKSYDFMKRNMPDVLTELVPDIVTNLELPLEIMQRKDILLCMRKDREKALSEEMYSSILCELKSIYPKYELHFTDTVIDRSVMPKDRETEVKAKLNQFAQHKFVVTDRLHGMIFAAITNTPCIALGNSNGKVKGVYEAWLKNNQYIRYVADANQFGDVLREMDLDVEYMYNRDSMTKSLEPIEKCLRVGDYMDGVKDKKFIQKYWI